MRKIFVALLLVFVLQAALFIGLAQSRPLPDEGRYLTTGWMICQGKVPFVDTFSPKPPSIEFVLAGLFALFGPSYLVARLLSVLVALAQIALLFVFVKKIFGEKAALLSALFYALWSSGFSGYFAIIEPFLALFSTAAVFFSYSFLFEGQKSKHLCLFGFFLGLTVVFKQTMIPFAAAMLVALIALNYFKNKRIVSVKKISFFALGFVAVPFLLLLYLLANNALPQFIEAMLFPLSQMENFGSVIIEARALIAVAAFSAVPIALIAFFAKKIGGRENLIEISLLFAWFVFSISNALPFRGCCLHLLPLLPPASIFAGFLIARSLSGAKKGLPEKLFAFFSICLLVASAFAAGFFFFVLSAPAYSFSSAEQVALFVKQNSSTQDTILVFRASPEIYFLSQRMPGARQFIFFDPCDEKCQGAVIADMRQRKPEIVVYFMHNSEKAESGMLLLDSFVQENYNTLEAMQLQPPLYRFYTHAVILKKKG
jgi:4-amino-4-deoxy-L-arabinose transferase-like glycosyltransferase